MKCLDCGMELPSARRVTQRAIACPGCGREHALYLDEPPAAPLPEAVTNAAGKVGFDPPQSAPAQRSFSATQATTPPPEDMEEDLTGREFMGGMFRLERKIGYGGMGQVYIATQMEPRRRAAIKIARDINGDSRQVQRLRQEAQILSQLDHHNIVKLLQVGESDGRYFLSMQYVKGPAGFDKLELNLAQLLKSRKRLTAEETWRMLQPVLDAVAHAHTQGIIHRDLKPENILINEQMEPGPDAVLPGMPPRRHIDRWAGVGAP